MKIRLFVAALAAAVVFAACGESPQPAAPDLQPHWSTTTADSASTDNGGSTPPPNPVTPDSTGGVGHGGTGG